MQGLEPGALSFNDAIVQVCGSWAAHLCAAGWGLGGGTLGAAPRGLF